MYKIYQTSMGTDAAIKINQDGSVTSFIFDPANTDYAEYLKWLDAGNTPLPSDSVADEVPNA